jgi:hypothetical protein
MREALAVVILRQSIVRIQCGVHKRSKSCARSCSHAPSNAEKSEPAMMFIEARWRVTRVLRWPVDVAAYLGGGNWRVISYTRANGRRYRRPRPSMAR